MEAILLDEREIQALRERRRQTGADRFDETWEGIYILAPLASNEHQRVATTLAHVFMEVAPAGARVLAGANVSARGVDWEHDYRCPDVVVVMPDGVAKDAGTHWRGGPDVVVEVVSPNDRSRDKLTFYETLGVREVLLVDRDTKALELHVLRGGKLELVPTSAHASSTSAVLGLTLRVQAAPAALHVEHAASGRSWTV